MDKQSWISRVKANGMELQHAPDPIKNDVKYQAAAQPFLVFGILDTALAIGHHGPL